MSKSAEEWAKQYHIGLPGGDNYHRAVAAIEDATALARAEGRREGIEEAAKAVEQIVSDANAVGNYEAADAHEYAAMHIRSLLNSEPKK